MMSLAVSNHEDLRDYSIEVRVRNARILGLMLRAGIDTLSELARRTGVANQMIGKLVNLKITPLDKITGNYLSVVQRIADALYCHPDDMFTDCQRTQFMVSNRRCVEVAEAEVEAHLAALEVVAPDEHVALLERDDAIGKALTRLTPRERAVIEARFGLDGGPEQTLEQLGETYTLSGNRIRQIEGRALHKLGKITAGLHGVAGVENPEEFDSDAFIEHQARLIAEREAAQREEREAGQREGARRAAEQREAQRSPEAEREHEVRRQAYEAYWSQWREEQRQADRAAAREWKSRY